MLLSALRRRKAPPRARNPSNAIIGNALAVAGSILSASAAGVDATSVWAGGGVTTSATCTSSPVGLMAMMGARLSSTTMGASADLIGSAISRGISAGVNKTGTLVALASSIAFDFGYTNSSPQFLPG